MLTIRLLGQFSLTLDGIPIELPSRPAQSLLAWLVLHPGVAHRRERLAGLFWPDANEENAHNNLRHALWRLRRAIPEAFVITDRIAIRWAENGDWQVDVAGLLGATANGCGADELIPSLAAYSGDLLPGFYDEWVHFERERLAALYDDRMARLLDLLLTEQRWREAIDWAEKWIAQGRTPEAAYQALIHAHASQGNLPAALAAYQRCVDALDRELGVPPSPETVALAESIHNSQFTIHHSPFPHSHFPLPPTLISNLPAPTTPLIGREEELAQLVAFLASPDHRLVTLLGPGGMGKSRLALAAGHAASERFPDGIFLVELTPLTDPEAIAQAIGDALGYPYQNDPRPLRQQILSYLRGRHLLLILDNFEHLLEGAALLVEILETGPDLHLLVTSRERLRLHAETIFRLEGLDYAAHREENSLHFPYAAASLFIANAQRADNRFQMEEQSWPSLLRICRLVGGMPLGIILAASWVRFLTIPEIADELAASIAFLGQDLQDLEPRHRRLEAVFAQSWRRLSPTEQQILMGLSIFAGGFDREGAHAVAAASLPGFLGLVDRSLLWRVEDGRYDLHELIRQFSRQKLAESGEEEANRARHSRWFLGLVARLEDGLKGSGDAQAIQQLEMERENIAAAWRWAAGRAEIDGLLAAVEALGLFYNRPGRWVEGAALIASAIDALADPVEPRARLLLCWLLAWRDLYLHRTGQVAQARQSLTDLLAQLDSEPLPPNEVLRLRAFAHLHRSGDLMTDRQRGKTGEDLRRALALYEELDDRWWRVQSLTVLTNWEFFNGQMGQAWNRASQAAELARQLGHRNSEAVALSWMSFVAEFMGETAAGVQLARDALTLESDPARRVQLISRLTFALLAVGEFEESATLSADAIAWWKHRGFEARALVFIENTLARAYLHLGRFSEARSIAEKAERQWREIYGWEHPFLLRTLSRALLALGEAEESWEMILRTVESQRQMGNDNLFALSGALLDCVYPAPALGKLTEVTQFLVEGLRLTQRSEAFDHCCRTLPGIALLLAEEGHLSEAAFVAGAIQRHPRLTASRFCVEVALDRLEELLAPLPPDVRSAAEERGREMELPELTAELLTLL